MARDEAGDLSWPCERPAFRHGAGDRREAFRPEEFFVGRCRGEGVLRDPLGRHRARCEIESFGVPRLDRSEIGIRVAFKFDDGGVDIWRWVMREGGRGLYLVAEAKAGAGIIGRYDGSDYVLKFRRPVGRARGVIAPSFAARLTPVGQGEALKTVGISLYGAPLASFVGVLRRAT